MVYKSLIKDFFYEDSGSTALSYYLTCSGETIYTGKAYNPKGIKINIRKLVEDWLWNAMPDFRLYNNVAVTHPEAYRQFNLYTDEGTLLETYKVLLSYEPWSGGDMTLNSPIDGKTDPRQKFFINAVESVSTAFDVSGWERLNITFDEALWFPASGGTFTIGYEANSSFTVSESCSWYSVSKNVVSSSTLYEKGNLTFVVSANTSPEKNCYIYFKQDDFVGSDCTQEGVLLPVLVTQAGYGKYFTIGNKSVGWPGGNTTISYDTNYEDEELNFVMPSGVTLVSYGNGSLVVNVPKNRNIERTFTIKVYRVEDGAELGTCVITQAEAQEYLTIEVLEDGTFKGLADETNARHQVNVNGTGWQSIGTINNKSVKAGDVIMIRGVRSGKTTGDNTITVTGGKFKAYGNPLTLIYGSESGHFACEKYGALRLLFKDSTIVDAGDLNLDLGLYQACFVGMFYNCKYLTVPPELPQTTLANGCYGEMFSDCTSLTTAPALPATTLESSCYAGMFQYCTSLTSAPVLPATTGIASNCYRYMFNHDEKLNYINCSAVFSGNSSDYCEEWVYGVASAGTFVAEEGMEEVWPYGINGIPWGWMDRKLGYTGITGDYSTQYVTLEILSGGTLCFGAEYNINYYTGTDKRTTVVYSLNGGDWNYTFPVSGYSYTSALTVSQGDVVLLKGYYYDRERYYTQYTMVDYAYAPTLHGSTAKFNVYGNAMSMLYGGNYMNVPHVSGETRAFAHLFEQSGAVNARNLVMPDGTYAAWGMLDMFYGCEYLTTSPIIRVTNMVYPGDTFTELFYNCTSLTDIVCLYDNPGNGDDFQRWVKNVPANGTFTKKQGVQWTSGENGIPNGWTVQEIA